MRGRGFPRPIERDGNLAQAAQQVEPQDYFATIPAWTGLIPWQDRINIEVSLHIFDDALRGNDQREMRFSPYWIYRGLFPGG